MLNTKILKQSLFFSSLAIFYIVIVSTVMQNASRFIGSDNDSMFAPIVFLLLLVISAATMGVLIFGKPVMLYIDGKKREAVQMVAYTISCLAIFTVLLFVVIAVSRVV